MLTIARSLIAGIFLCFSSFCFPSEPQVDVVVFSCNRPMQLYAFLESLEKYVQGYDCVHIICRADNDLHVKGYQIVSDHFPKVTFHYQGKKPNEDFKPLVLSAAFSHAQHSPYVVFAVDDIIVCDDIDFSDCVKALEKNNAWGFFLRMGLNIKYGISDKNNPVTPNGSIIEETFYLWDSSRIRGVWAYATTVDFTVYRKKDIFPFFNNIQYGNPNVLEGSWWSYRNYICNKTCICYLHSKVVNNNINIVKERARNKYNGKYSSEQLLHKFLSGYKIDIVPFHKINNISTHEFHEITFVPR